MNSEKKEKNNTSNLQGLCIILLLAVLYLYNTLCVTVCVLVCGWEREREFNNKSEKIVYISGTNYVCVRVWVRVRVFVCCVCARWGEYRGYGKKKSSVWLFIWEQTGLLPLTKTRWKFVHLTQNSTMKVNSKTHLLMP